MVYGRHIKRSFSQGYYKNSRATKETLQDGWFYTGDLCRLDADGNLFFIGRRKHVVRRRGENISCERSV